MVEISEEVVAGPAIRNDGRCAQVASREDKTEAGRNAAGGDIGREQTGKSGLTAPFRE